MGTTHPIPPRIAVAGDVISERSKAKLQTAVRDFESLFVGYMLKSMRESMATDEMFGDNFGGDILDGMFDTELARQMSRNSGFGLAEMLYRKMTGEALPVQGTTSQTPKDVLPVRPEYLPGQIGSPAGSGGAGVSSPTPPPPAANATAAQATGTPAASRTPSPVTRMHDVSAHAVSPRHVNDKIDQRLIPYESAILEAAEKHGLDPNLIKAVIASESGGNASAQSPKNAKGLMQLVDTTATDMGVKNVWDPKQNIFGGSRYLQLLLQRFSGDVDSALASYNAGPGAVEKHRGVPPFKETQAYVRKVKDYFQYFSNLEGDGDDGK
jgi:Rod binding domain-containing protein